jgi:hypothetical protein
MLHYQRFPPFGEKLQARGIAVFLARCAALTLQSIQGAGLIVTQHDLGFTETNALIVLHELMVSHRKPRTFGAGVVDRFARRRRCRGACWRLLVATHGLLVVGAGHARAGGGFAGFANALITAIEKRATVIGYDRFPAVHIVDRGVATGASGSTNRE